VLGAGPTDRASRSVTLEGTLEWNYQRDLAESAVRSVKGVSGVINAITLTLGTQLLGRH
jgi:osmotically-inducible protein OsmY